MSWHYLQDLVEESSEESCSGGARSVQLSLIPTAGRSSSNDNGTGSSPPSPSGTMSRHSTGDPGVDRFIASVVDSRVLISPQPGREQASTERNLGSGVKWPGSWVRFDPDTSSWRTRQCSLLGGLDGFSGTWPRWGTMRGGECWVQEIPAHLTSGTESGLWPTPTVDPERPCEGNVRMYRAKVIAGEMTEGEATAMLHGKSPFEAQGVIPSMGRNTSPGRSWPTPSAGWGGGGVANSGDVLPIRALVDAGQMPYEEALCITRGAVHHKGLKPWREEEHDQYLAAHGKHYSGAAVKLSILPNRSQNQHTRTLGRQIKRADRGHLNPDWVEWLMGWPVGWTSLDPLSDLGEWFSGAWWDVEPDDLARTSQGCPNRPKRLRAIGNGQVPACVVMAWQLLVTDAP
jgi:hypothetical protein